MVTEGFELHIVGRIEEDLAVQLKGICPDIHIWPGGRLGKTLF